MYCLQERKTKGEGGSGGGTKLELLKATKAKSTRNRKSQTFIETSNINIFQQLGL